jgi:hyperosmotically inducible protein
MTKAKSAGTIFLASLLCGAVSMPAALGQKPDNTKVNQKDRNGSSPTADQQKANSTDTELTKKIRSAIVADKTLSTYAHNVKVISQDGTVTLKGPVRSEEEKTAVEAKATEAAGGAKVVNELTVAPKGKPR